MCIHVYVHIYFLVILFYSFWSRLEIFCRELAARYHEVRLITGPLFLPQDNNDEEEKDKSFIHYEVNTCDVISVPLLLCR